MSTTYRPIGVENLEIAYSSPTFTIRGTGGRNLSTSNPAVVTMSSVTAGQVVSIQVTANQTFIDDTGTSEIIGNLFGLTTSVATTVDVPFFLYACLSNSDGGIGFGISRIANLINAPATANLGSASSATADVQNSIFLLNDPTLGDYDTNPVLLIGSFTMRMSASDDWTVQTLTSSDGIGVFNENVTFTGMLGQFGANVSTYCVPNGGTPAIFLINQQEYKIIDAKNGLVEVNMVLRNDGGGDGAGAVIALVTVPYNADFAFSNIGPIHGSAWITTPGATGIGITKARTTSNVQSVWGVQNSSSFFQWSQFSNGLRNWESTLKYKIKAT